MFELIGLSLATTLGLKEPGYKFHVDMTLPTAENFVFVFGSNLEGIHGGGSARVAHEKYDAEWGNGDGFTSHCSYAVPTCEVPGGEPKLSLEQIQEFVHELGDNVDINEDCEFFITRIGCGIVGYSDAEIAPLFKDFPSNCNFPIEWKPYL